MSELLSFYDYEVIRKLPTSAWRKLINHSIDKENDRALQDSYKLQYPFMVQGVFEKMEYSDFKKKYSRPSVVKTITKITDEEATEEMLGLVKSYEERRRFK